VNWGPHVDTSSVFHDEDFLGYGRSGILDGQYDLNLHLPRIRLNHVAKNVDAHWNQFGIDFIYDQFGALKRDGVIDGMFRSVGAFRNFGSLFVDLPKSESRKTSDDSRSLCVMTSHVDQSQPWKLSGLFSCPV
jgi:hypothetical protein